MTEVINLSHNTSPIPAVDCKLDIKSVQQRYWTHSKMSIVSSFIDSYIFGGGLFNIYLIRVHVCPSSTCLRATLIIGQMNVKVHIAEYWNIINR